MLGIQTITLRSRQLVYVLAMCMDKDDPTGEIVIDGTEFLNWINANGKRRWSNLHKLVDDAFINLNNNPVWVRGKANVRGKYDKKDFIKINWVQKCGVLNGKIIAQFTQEAARYFLYQKGLTYTNTIWDLRGYRSDYAARIVDLFQREHRHHKGHVNFTFDYDLLDLKIFFGVPDKYPRVTDFKRRVLDQAKDELAKDISAPYYFEHDVVKSGRNVRAIKFNVSVRPDELIRLAPEVELLTFGSQDQPSLFDATNDISDEKKRQIGAIVKNSLIDDKRAFNIVCNLSESQGRGFIILLKFGVNHSLAYRIVTDNSSFGELVGYEDQYIHHTVSALEKDRLKRIEESKNSDSKKRTTPKAKRGGLAKAAFEERRYFPSFMEKLSKIRKQEFEDQRDKRSKDDNFESLSDVIKLVKKVM